MLPAANIELLGIQMGRIVVKKVTIWIFVLIIFMPITLSQIEKITGEKIDVALLGYSDSAERPELTISTFLDGSFQIGYGNWTEENMPLRGVLTKTYNTIRYEAFDLGNRPIGNNGSIYEPEYLNAELAIGPFDYSTPERVEELQNMIAHIVSVNSKLRQIGKYLYVYIAPSKADIYPEDMPGNYVALSEPGAVNVKDLFREKISATDVPYLICSDMADELEYPAFYPTGIHWSRTYQQLVSQRVIDDLSALSGENYRNIIIPRGRAIRSTEPFWIESDVYDLLNVWIYPNIDYYEYPVEITESEFAAALNMLLMGDSFADGLKKDIEDNILEDTIFAVNRNSFMVEPNGTVHYIDGNWNNFDWQRYLDLSDFILVEATEPQIIHYTFGFIDYLDSYLDDYVPMEKATYYAFELDGNNEETWNASCSVGVWQKENGVAWIKPNCRIALSSKNISDHGLEIDYYVPQQSVAEEPEQVEIRINGTVVYEGVYTSPTEEKIIIKPDEFVPDKNDDYIVTIRCSNSFNPYANGESMDNRDLALALRYIGGTR